MSSSSVFLHRPYSEYASQIEFANACVCKCLELANRYEREALVVLIKLDSWIEIAGPRLSALRTEVRHRAMSEKCQNMTSEMKEAVD